MGSTEIVTRGLSGNWLGGKSITGHQIRSQVVGFQTFWSVQVTSSNVTSRCRHAGRGGVSGLPGSKVWERDILEDEPRGRTSPRGQPMTCTCLSVNSRVLALARALPLHPFLLRRPASCDRQAGTHPQSRIGTREFWDQVKDCL